MKYRFFFILLCVCASALVGCKSIQPSEVIRYKTDSIVHYKHDSIKIVHTDTVRIEKKNDTIYIENIKNHDYYHKIFIGDTIVKRDSIYVKDVIITNELNKGQRFFFYFGIACLVVIVIAIAFWIFKKIYFR